MNNMNRAQLIEYIRQTRPNNHQQPQQQMGEDELMSQESEVEDDLSIRSHGFRTKQSNLYQIYWFVHFEISSYLFSKMLK